MCEFFLKILVMYIYIVWCLLSYCTYFFLVICINIIGALEKYQNENDLNMIIMARKSKWINYFLIIISI